ncbi:hypothetical protein K2X89_04395 [Myxococcota bacterium]|nr:hypothetical protein [Myxococcota bacterium]
MEALRGARRTRSARRDGVMFRLALSTIALGLTAAPSHAAVDVNTYCVLGIGGFANNGPTSFLGSGTVDGTPVPFVAPPPVSVVKSILALGGLRHSQVSLDVVSSLVPEAGVPAVDFSGSCSADASRVAGTLRLQARGEQVDLIGSNPQQPFASAIASGSAEFGENFDVLVPSNSVEPVEVTLSMTLSGTIGNPGRDGWLTGVRTRLQFGSQLGTVASIEEFESDLSDRTLTLTAPLLITCNPVCESFFNIWVAIELFGRHPILGYRTLIGSGTQVDLQPVTVTLRSPDGVTLQRTIDGASWDWVNPVPEPALGSSVAALVGVIAWLEQRRSSARRRLREVGRSRELFVPRRR